MKYLLSFCIFALPLFSTAQNFKFYSYENYHDFKGELKRRTTVSEEVQIQINEKDKKVVIIDKTGKNTYTITSKDTGVDCQKKDYVDYDLKAGEKIYSLRKVGKSCMFYYDYQSEENSYFQSAKKMKYYY